jgi:hypothetical protein
MKKTGHEKSRDTVPLSLQVDSQYGALLSCTVFFCQVRTGGSKVMTNHWLL